MVQQHKILALYGYRTCNAVERIQLVEKALQFVKISAKPIYLFQMLIHYLENHRIVVPGYSFLQDIVSQALATERKRITEIIERSLDKNTRAVLDELYVNRDGVYAITALKHEPKDFSLKELKQEIARSRSLAGLYQTAHNLLLELSISNDSVTYYAAAGGLLHSAEVATNADRHGVSVFAVFHSPPLPKIQRQSD